MKDSTRKTLIWTPRILGFLMAAFLGVFALDAFSENQGVWRSLGAFLIHLVPTYMALGVVYIAWEREWFGAAAFLLLAAVYVATTLDHPSWILGIAGPLTLVGGSYLLSWHAARRARGT